MLYVKNKSLIFIFWNIVSYLIFVSIYKQRLVIWATASENAPSDFRTVWSKSSQGTLLVTKDPNVFRWIAKTHIRLWDCEGWPKL